MSRPKSPARTMLRIALTIGVLSLVAACKDEAEPEATEARPVRVVTVEERSMGETVSLAGTLESQVQVDLSFRLGGRVATRDVNVGDQVAAGQVLASLDPTDEENGLRAAEASLAAAEGQLSEAQSNFDRQRQLYDRGFLARAGLERAEAALTTATAQADAARAQYGIAKRRLNDTVLYADAPGTVTAIGAEPGEVVVGGRMVVQIARDGGMDAVFDLPAAIVDQGSFDTIISVAMSQNPAIATSGRVREVAPRADTVTGTFRVRVGLSEIKPEMRLGSTVTGTTTFDAVSTIEIPATALTRGEGEPAVWVVDPTSLAVALRPITVGRFTPASVVVESGLNPGDIVVTAGVQALRPGQIVRMPGTGA